MCWRNIVVQELIVAHLFVLLPFLPLLHLLWPEYSNEIIGLSIPSEYEDSQTFMWYLLTEISLTAIYSIFFLFLSHPIRWIFLAFATYYFSLIFYVLLNFGSGYLFSVEWFVISIFFAEQLIFLRDSFVARLDGFKKHASNLELVKEIFDRDNQKFNRLVDSLKNSVSPKGQNTQIYQIYHLTHIGKNRVKKYQKKHQNKSSRKSTVSSGAFLIMTFFLLFKYFYDYLPEENDSLNFLGIFSITGFGFPNVNSFLWYFEGKLEIIMSSLIWMIYSKEWWRNTIIPGISLFTFQLVEIFEPTTSIESSVTFRAIPITLAVLMIFWIVTKSMLIKARFLDNLSYLEIELERRLRKLV